MSPAPSSTRTASTSSSPRAASFHSAEFTDYLAALVAKYPIVTIEDGMSEGDWDGWSLLTSALGEGAAGRRRPVRHQHQDPAEGIARAIANAILIKPNQIGTLTETLAAIDMAERRRATPPIISHRSGETEDTTIADIAVGHRRHADQDRLDVALGSGRQVQPAAAASHRGGLWRALTPQVFAFAPLIDALGRAVRDRVTVTDEAQAMERLGVQPLLVAGSPFNIKVTQAEDLLTADRILRSTGAATMRIGQGYDVHAFGPGNFVMLGGVRITHSQGVVAHSDGDVVIHALCDAILGALAQGDIGQHFPDTDPRYRGADSRVFLREVAGRLRAAGLRLVNADITVIAEAPRISTHRAAMCQHLAADLGVGTERINIKATTTERLGFIGRGEGLAAQAAVLLDASGA
jgi:2-C-methyl-D-erythritol 2,4-cyclodiphosphate synthase